ncbi:MAG: hypothetical protein ALECFALPRED_009976 [Alectoria fallacina]|uniref:chitinase n=1 Tax=Alectoria fallacina TaxID=1903189 RepID=A0A8H3F319_9LECA|nr:MAG: hypothetical protein ALECFALPRED_009976 [Alectoria fallacina]
MALPASKIVLWTCAVPSLASVEVLLTFVTPAVKWVLADVVLLRNHLAAAPRYYESWAATRTCQSVTPEELNLTGFTHINFAFAYFDPSSFQIAPMDPNSESLLGRFTALKTKLNGLETWISVGGWSFTDPGPTQEAFSTMSSTSANRQMFINGLLQFMNYYGFDGVDLDWEYPQADDRGGQPADTENYVALAKELKAALGQKGLSMTLPTSFWYLQHFDVNLLQEYVDWFNFMSYDLHGVWDAQSQFVGPYIAPHTNLTEIDLGLDLLWRAGVEADKVNLGMAWYGRSFTLSDPSCNTPNGVCQFSGGANPGPCSGTSGILDDQEIQDVITQNSLTPTWDHTAGVKWITWDSNQWVSYDDADTFQEKKDFASQRCLGGLMVWAMDQKDQGTSPNLKSTASNGTTCGQTFGVTTGDLHSISGKDNCSFNTSSICVPLECEVAQLGNNQTCTSMASSLSTSSINVTIALFLQWNPNIIGPCENLTVDQYICTGPPGGNYTLPAPISDTNSSAGGQQRGGQGSGSNPNGPDGPDGPTPNSTVSAPTQVGIAKNCNAFAYADTNDTCYDMSQSFDITLAQFTTWNPVLGYPDGQNCTTQFWTGYDYCVGVSGTSTSSSSISGESSATISSLSYQTQSASATISSLPYPTQSGITPACNKYADAKAGDYCYMFAQNNNITTDELYSWNGILGPNGANCSTEFQAGYDYCRCVLKVRNGKKHGNFYVFHPNKKHGNFYVFHHFVISDTYPKRSRKRLQQNRRSA